MNDTRSSAAAGDTSEAGPSEAPRPARDSHTALRAAIQKYDKRDMAAAFDVALPLAEGGHREAQKLVGNLLAQGALGRADLVAARQWWLRAALQGDPTAQFNVGMSYLDPDGGPVDVDAARTWLAEASMGGHKDAMRELGKWLLENATNQMQAAEGYFCVHMAAVQGDAAARMMVFAQLIPTEFAKDRKSLDRLRAEALRYTAPYCGVVGRDLLGQTDRDEEAAYRTTCALYAVAGEQSKVLNAFTEFPDKPSPLTLAETADIAVRRIGAMSPACATTWILIRRGLRQDSVRCVPLPVERLWDLIRPGDAVELSDGINAHVSFAWSIDRDRDLIRFLDVWPDEFLLLPGFNALGIEAKTLPLGQTRRLIEARRDDFLPAVRGLSSNVGIGSIEILWGAIAEAREDPAAALGLALTLMERPSVEMTARGLGWLVALLRGTLPGVPPAALGAAADRAWMAAEWLRDQGDPDISVACGTLGVSGRKEMVVAIMDELEQRWPPSFETLGARALTDAILRRGQSKVASIARANPVHQTDDAGYEFLLRFALGRYPDSEHLRILSAERDLFSGRAETASREFAEISERLEERLRQTGPLVRDIYDNAGGTFTNRPEIQSALIVSFSLRARALFALGLPALAADSLKSALAVSDEAGVKRPDLLRLLLEAASAARNAQLVEETKARLLQLGERV
ncbi:MAG TPA: tetratricopeptide repeat protein [Vicinamibacterales bacterium]|jgi:hypothetical protein